MGGFSELKIFLTPFSERAYYSPRSRERNKFIRESSKEVGLDIQRNCTRVQMSQALGGTVTAKQSAKCLGQLIWVWSLFVCLSVCIAIPAKAQVLFGSVVGAGSDATGAALPGATVTITSLQTNETRTVTTARAGIYTIYGGGRYLAGQHQKGSDFRPLRTLMLWSRQIPQFGSMHNSGSGPSVRQSKFRVRRILFSRPIQRRYTATF